jgi:hypothetical protein
MHRGVVGGGRCGGGRGASWPHQLGCLRVARCALRALRALLAQKHRIAVAVVSRLGFRISIQRPNNSPEFRAPPPSPPLALLAPGSWPLRWLLLLVAQRAARSAQVASGPSRSHSGGPGGPSHTKPITGTRHSGAPKHKTQNFTNTQNIPHPHPLQAAGCRQGGADWVLSARLRRTQLAARVPY